MVDAEEDSSSSDENAVKRVKVYQLNDDGQWDDKGTGHVSYGLKNNMPTFEVHYEETGESLLSHIILESIEYQRQGETIITWCEEDGIDLALSFQEEERCNDVWLKLSEFQASKQNEHDADGGMEIENEEIFLDTMVTSLPSPEMQHLEEICRRVVEVATPAEREMVSNCALQDGYAQQLFSLFHTVEDLEQVDVCFILFNIFKGLFMLNDSSLLDFLLNDDNIMDLIATLEYDPDLPPDGGYQNHRQFLKRANFKEVVPVRDKDVRAKIEQNYLITYIKDVVLLRYLDDNTLATLSSTVFFNNLLIIQKLTQDVSFMEELFAKLHRVARQPNNPTAEGQNERQEIFKFLQELCNLSKGLQTSVRDAFYDQLTNCGLLDSIGTAMVSSCPHDQLWLWLSCTDVLTNVLTHNPNLLRTHFLSRLSVRDSLLACLVKTLVSEKTNSGLGHQLAQILRLVFDPENMIIDQREVFLDHIYDAQVEKIVAALNRKVPATSKHMSKYFAVELLWYCVQQHGSRMLNYMLNHGVMRKVANLIYMKGRPNIVCSAIRFLRTCLGLRDATYSRYMVQHKLLDPMMEIFFENGARYNLINSVIIELVNFVRQANIKEVIHELVSRFEHKFKAIQYVGTFQELKIRWEQNQEGPLADQSSDDGQQQLMHSADIEDPSQYEYFNRDNSDEEVFPHQLQDVQERDEGAEKEKEAQFEAQTQKLRQQRNQEVDTEKEFDFRKLEEKAGPSLPTNSNPGRLRGLTKGRTIGINLKTNPNERRQKRQKLQEDDDV